MSFRNPQNITARVLQTALSGARIVIHEIAGGANGPTGSLEFWNGAISENGPAALQYIWSKILYYVSGVGKFKYVPQVTLATGPWSDSDGTGGQAQITLNGDGSIRFDRGTVGVPGVSGYTTPQISSVGSQVLIKSLNLSNDPTPNKGLDGIALSYNLSGVVNSSGYVTFYHGLNVTPSVIIPAPGNANSTEMCCLISPNADNKTFNAYFRNIATGALTANGTTIHLSFIALHQSAFVDAWSSV